MIRLEFQDKELYTKSFLYYPHRQVERGAQPNCDENVQRQDD